MLAHFFRKPETCSVLCISENLSLVYISLLVHPGPVAYLLCPHLPVTSIVPGYLNLASPSIAFFSIMAFILKPSHTAWDFLWFTHRSVLKTREPISILTRWQHSLDFPIHWTSMDSWQSLHSADALHVFLALPCPAWRTLLHLFPLHFPFHGDLWFIPLPSPQA